ncbi:MAG: integrase arm-type DNA-binding domain-containing protein [Pseudomonadota bacterium]|nr:integrase arm-type DNA-binding domain-containing protein [Pseudomonadota bacterium]
MGSSMAHGINRLSARAVETTKNPGLLADGGGLYLQVSKSGAASWLYKFMLNGRSREMGLGSLKAVSLADAREKAALCRCSLANGIDPIEARKADRSRNIAADQRTVTFADAADAYIATHESGWKNAKHASQWRNTLAAYAYPIAGQVLVSDVDTEIVMRILRPIWAVKPETAGRLRGRIERILDWATVSGYRQGQNPAQWRGHLDNLLPAKSRIHDVKHHPAMPYQEIGDFILQLRERDGIAAQALEFLIYTAARTSEVRGALWAEFDLDSGVWTIPGLRTKAGKEHRIPLAERPLEIVRELKRNATGDFVFPGGKPGKRLSDMALLSVLRRLEIKQTVHGFRSSFRDWAAEQTQFPREVAEQALAHTIANKVEAAYLRSDLLEKRRHLMNRWATHLDTPKGEVVA